MEVQVEQLISKLLKRYEDGGVSRRELVGTLALLTLASETASAAEFESSTLNHVSIVVSNLDRSIEFYRRVFGLSVESEDRANELVQLKLGRSHLSIRRRNGRTGVDHFAIGLDRFNRDAVIADLRRRGATPQDGNNAGLHVLDPDGVPVQVIANPAA
jgi:catechol 2,3-dioxygenase-like lactoylglutathione lyase family enzyme